LLNKNYLRKANPMQEYDVIIIGSGAGMNVASNALAEGLNVAVLDHGPLGGTCLNNGCIPSKILLYPAEVIRKMQDAADIGVHGKITKVDFDLIMERMKAFVDDGRHEMEHGVSGTKNIMWYQAKGEFTGDHTMKVGDEIIHAPKIIIASGSRPQVPKIEGLKETGYIDNVSLLELKKLPKSLVIIGGGYIACEYGHFFSAMGTNVTILGHNERLLKNEEPEISAIVQKRFGKYVKVLTGMDVSQAQKSGWSKSVIARERSTNKVFKFTTDEIMVAAGRISNADILKPERTGVETDEHGWIKVNEYLETTKEGIWALGDATGKYMFRHNANHESDVVWANAFTDKRRVVDHHAVPHAVFGYPEVAAVGLTQAEAKAAGYQILVGKAPYSSVTKGYAMKEDDSLVKVIVDQKTRKILGCHIVGTDAAILVQQVVYMMNTDDQTYLPLARSQVIHPALSEAVIQAFARMVPPDHVHHFEGAPPEGHGHQE
jgi:mycothione reductase